MRTAGQRESRNVEDRRGRGMRAGTIGGGGLILVLLALLFGVDPGALLDPGAPQVTEQPMAGTPADEEQVRFIRVVLGSTEDVWHEQFRRHGATYQEPTLTLFRGAVATACGTQHSHVGPFYCPGDHRVYLDLTFFDLLRERLGAPGDFAQAYVIAHEVGHHVQDLLGYSDHVQRMRGRVSEREFNEWSVRLELQADFLAGVWAHHAQRLRDLLEEGDVEEAMRAAAAVGDDVLQRRSTGTVRLETFTHGTAEQRRRAFQLGFETGDLGRASEFFTARGF